MTKSINILGVTGTIGQAVCDVILANPGVFDVRMVSAHTNVEKLAVLAQKLSAQKAIILHNPNPEEGEVLRGGLAGAAQKLSADTALLTQNILHNADPGEKEESLADLLVGSDCEALIGEAALMEALAEPVDITVCAIVGMAGLPSMMAAIETSKVVAIANKEPLVAAGALVMAHAEKHGTILLPIDSEHNAVFQVFDPDNRDGIEKIVLTASGGPFREWSVEKIQNATVEQALKHPNWVMGDKITIDSATMANKALEIIEAHYLFGMEPDKIDVVVHPQSVVHSMVEYKDGSVLAQMGASDMRTPIAHVLGYPERIGSGGETLDIQKLSQLTFESPDFEKFPFLQMAYECLEKGGYACVVMNAANEVAVDAFLTNRIRFGDIINIVQDCLDLAVAQDINSLDEILKLDQSVRVMAQQSIQTYMTQMAVS